VRTKKTSRTKSKTIIVAQAERIRPGTPIDGRRFFAHRMPAQVSMLVSSIHP
jgi:hypothetical protein